MMRKKESRLFTASIGLVFLLLIFNHTPVSGDTYSRPVSVLAKVDSYTTDDGVIYAVQNRILSAVDPSTGITLWRAKGRGNTAKTKVFVRDGTLYYHSSDPKGTSLSAIDLDTQKLVWEYKHAADDSLRPLCFLDAGQGLVAYLGNETFLRVFQGETGEILWSYNYYAYNANVYPIQPMITDKYIIYADTFSGLTVFEKGTGKTVFHKLNGKIQGFSQSGGVIYWWMMTGNKHGHLCVTSLSRTAEEILTLDFRNPIDAALFQKRTMLYTTFDRAALAALDLITFEKRWEFVVTERRKTNHTQTTIIYNNGLVYLAGLDDYIYAVDYKTGKARWRVDVKGVAREVRLEGDKLFYLDPKNNLLYIRV